LVSDLKTRYTAALLLIILMTINMATISGTYIKKKTPQKDFYPKKTLLNIKQSSEIKILENVSITKPPILYDIDQDGIDEVLVPSNDTLIALRYNSTSQRLEEIWRTWLGHTYSVTIKPGPKNISESYIIETSPICADFNGDGKIEIAIGASGRLFFINNTGKILKEFALNKTIAEISVMDIDFDGALEAIMRFNDKKISYVDMFSHTNKEDDLTETSTKRMILMSFPKTGSTSHMNWLVITLSEEIHAVAHNETSIKDFAEKIYSEITPGNYSLETSNEAQILVILKEKIEFLRFPTRETDLTINSTNMNNMTFDTIQINPISADFDGDNYDEAFIWLKYNDSISTISFVGIENITNKTPEIIMKNISAINVTPISQLALRTGSNTSAYVLLSNGTLLRFDMISNNISVENITNIKNASYLLAGDIDGDTKSELLIITNSETYMYDLNADNDWTTMYHDQKNTNNINEPRDWDMDGYADSIDPTWNDSDTDDDWSCDFTEYLNGTKYNEIDLDSDQLPDGFELRFGYKNGKNDSNDDGVLDTYEDEDNDTIDNIFEWKNRTNPLDNDTDNDGISDFDEINGTFNKTTDPTTPDTDGDAIPDKWEIDHNLDPTNSTDANMDLDSDGLLNIGEYIFGTNVSNKDTDNDRLYDGYEVYYGLDPKDSSDATGDKDGDNLNNYIEFVAGTDPTQNDTDKDGLLDGWEWIYGLDPLDPGDNDTDVDADGLSNIEEYKHNTNPRMVDTDGDEMPDGWEVTYNFDPTDPNDAYKDEDKDSLINKEEYKHNTNPLNPDTDGDGLSDGMEVSIGTNPLNPDTDGDGLSDYEEVESGHDPLSKEENAYLRIYTYLAIAVLIILTSSIFFARKKQ